MGWFSNQVLCAVVVLGLLVSSGSTALGGGRSDCLSHNDVCEGEDEPALVHVRIVSSLPLIGFQASFTHDIVNAIKMALDDAHHRAGRAIVDYESMNDASKATGRFDPKIEAQNATLVAADPSVVAYIGPFNSGAAKRSIPILCQAGVAMVSPSNTYVGLTKPGLGLANEPAVYYPSCPRNYARVIPADDEEGAAGALLASRLGATKAYLIGENAIYSSSIRSAFRSRASRIGLAIVGEEVVSSNAPSTINAVVQRILASGADFVYDAAAQTVHVPAPLLIALRAGGSQAIFMGPDALLGPSWLLPAAGSSAEGAYATDYLHTDSYTGAQARWAARYTARFGPLATEPSFAINAFDATNVVLAAIRRAGASLDRAAVRMQVMATHHFNGLLGHWSFDANGDINVASYSVLRVSAGSWVVTGVVSFTDP